MSLSLRFTGQTPKKGATRCMRMDEKDLPEVSELDLKLFEAPRAKVLRRVLTDFPQHYFLVGKAEGCWVYNGQARQGIHQDRALGLRSWRVDDRREVFTSTNGRSIK